MPVIERLSNELNESEQRYIKLLRLCENMLKAWDEMQKLNNLACDDDQMGSTPEMDVAVGSLREMVCPEGGTS